MLTLFEPSNIYVISKIVNELSQAEQRRAQKFIDQMHLDNQEAWRDRFDAFSHEGIIYIPSTSAGSAKRKYVHISLNDKMNKYLAERKAILDDFKFIQQGLHVLLPTDISIQGARDALPDFIARMIPEFAKLDRTNEIAWTIKYNSRAMKLFNKILPKMEFYSVTGLLY